MQHSPNLKKSSQNKSSSAFASERSSPRQQNLAQQKHSPDRKHKSPTSVENENFRRMFANGQLIDSPTNKVNHSSEFNSVPLRIKQAQGTKTSGTVAAHEIDLTQEKQQKSYYPAVSRPSGGKDRYSEFDAEYYIQKGVPQRQPPLYSSIDQTVYKEDSGHIIKEEELEDSPLFDHLEMRDRTHPISRDVPTLSQIRANKGQPSRFSNKKPDRGPVGKSMDVKGATSLTAMGQRQTSQQNINPELKKKDPRLIGVMGMEDGMAAKNQNL